MQISDLLSDLTLGDFLQHWSYVQKYLNMTTQIYGISLTSSLLPASRSSLGIPLRGGNASLASSPARLLSAGETSACLVPFHQCQRHFMITGFSSVTDWIQVEGLISRTLIASLMNRHHGAFRIRAPRFTFTAVKLGQTKNRDNLA